MRRIIPISIIVLIIVGGGIGYLIYRHRNREALPNGTGISVEVAPAGSDIAINGMPAKEGFTSTTVGKVEVRVSHAGFATSTQMIDVSDGQSRYIGIALVPNTPETLNWYDTHPKDKQKAEGISSKTFDDNSNQIAKDTPFIKELPYIGAGNEFRIDYGPDQSSNSSKQVIYITAGSQEARDDALTWIRGEGYDPSTMTIVYK